MFLPDSYRLSGMLPFQLLIGANLFSILEEHGENWYEWPVEKKIILDLFED